MFIQHTHTHIHTHTYTHTRARTHARTQAPQGRWTEEKVFEKRKVFREDLNELNCFIIFFFKLNLKHATSDPLNLLIL